jgi:hypothetical protein
VTNPDGDPERITTTAQQRRTARGGTQNMPWGKPISLPETQGELREQAERARRLAREVTGDVIEGRLLALAEELEARIAAMEALQIMPQAPIAA